MNSSRPSSFLVLAPNDPYFFAIFSKIVFSLSKKYPNHLILVSPIWSVESDAPIPLRSLIGFLKYFKRRFLYIASQLSLKQKVYEGICFDNSSGLPINVKVIGFLDIIRICGFYSALFGKPLKCRGLKEKISIGHIVVGDLLIDTYLRFKPSPSVNFEDPFFNTLLKKSKNIYSYFDSIFSQYDIQSVFGSYATYIYHGLPLRLAKSLDIKSFTFGGFDSFYIYHDQSSILSHSCDHTLYLPSIKDSAGFQKLTESACKSLDNRLHGRHDVSTSYMQEYSTTDILPEAITNAHIIFLHDFFDSPHIYRWMLHNDFYHWITDTIDILLQSHIKFYIKPHPNQSSASKNVVSSLMQKYSHETLLNWISDKVSNSVILKSNPSLVVSVYGSVLVEAAYCGVKSISAGDHPAYNFNIAYNPLDLNDYHQKLQNPCLIPSPCPQDSIVFLAQHYKAYDPDNIPSLISYLGCSFNQLSVDQKLLHSPSVHSFIQSSVDHILNTFPFL